MSRCFRLLAFILLVASAAAQPASAQPAPSATAPATEAAVLFGMPYPNPFTGGTTLTYTLGADGPVRLELFDALGRRVSVVEDGARPAGEYRLRLDGSALPPGLYIVRLTAGDQVVTRRLVRGT